MQAAPQDCPRPSQKAGATSATVEGVTYTFGQAERLTDTDRELAEFEAPYET